MKENCIIITIVVIAVVVVKTFASYQGQVYSTITFFTTCKITFLQLVKSLLQLL